MLISNPVSSYLSLRLTLLIAVSAGSQAPSTSCTSSCMQLDMTLAGNKKDMITIK